jgi:hypothetical protein
LRDAVGDADRRDLEQIDDKDRVVELILRVGRGQIDLHWIGDISVALIGALLLDRHKQIHVITGGLKPQFREMRCEIIYAVTCAARQFENIAAFWEDLLEHTQDRIAISIARPSDVRTQWIRVDWRSFGGDVD